MGVCNSVSSKKSHGNLEVVQANNSNKEDLVKQKSTKSMNTLTEPISKITSSGELVYNKKSSFKSLRELMLKNNVSFFNVKQEEEVNRFYKLGKQIGNGSFGIVHSANHFNPEIKIKFAIKSIDTSIIKQEDLLLLKSEIKSLKTLDHPNIIKLQEFFFDQNYIHIVMECCSGGDLLDYMSERGAVDEKEAKHIMFKLISAMNHCHLNKIVHRDLKPENILFESKDRKSELKIIDFGMAVKFSGKSLDSLVGSPFFIAPEVIQGSHDEKCDIWSLGVIMYMLLSGNPPFIDENKEKLFEKILKDELQFEGDCWENICDQAKNLIAGMLCKNPKDRPAAAALINHNWFDSHNKQIHRYSFLNANFLTNLKDYSYTSNLKKDVIHIMTNFLSQKELDDAEKFFIRLDKENTGKITIDELKQAFEKFGNNLPPEELNELVDKFKHEDKWVTYSDFLEALAFTKFKADSRFLKNSFNYLDSDKDGIITFQDLELSFTRTASNKKSEDILKLLSELGLDENSKITFEQYKEIILPNTNFEKGIKK